MSSPERGGKRRKPPLNWFTGVILHEDAGITLISVNDSFYSLHPNLGANFEQYMHRRLNFTDSRGRIQDANSIPSYIQEAAKFVQRTTGFHPQEIDMFIRVLSRAFHGKERAPFEVVNLSKID